ncbi:MAG: 3-phosphoglycerate dehydrogenase, partial [Oscillospiraceae bacterium]
HLGASTPESEENCAVMAANEIKDFLENGNIKNSVNYPACDMGIAVGDRVTVAHKNVPTMLKQITDTFANKGINIDHMLNKSRGDFAYTMLDNVGKIDPAIINNLSAIDGVLKVTLL